MKASGIVIDAKKREVREVEVDSENWRAIAGVLGCDYFTIAESLPNGDALFVDDEGWLKANADGFGFGEAIFAGSGFVLGSDEDGETVNAKTDVEAVRKAVRWVPLTSEMQEKALEWDVMFI